MVATNTTVSRAGLRTPNVDKMGAGGLSGRPLMERSSEVVAKIYSYSNGTMPVVGVGGIFTGDDAFAKITAGATLVQAYTGFIYGGPSFAHKLNVRLADLLTRAGFPTLDAAVGSRTDRFVGKDPN